MKPKSAPYQKALRERRKAEGLKTLIRYVRPEWIPEIDNLIKELENSMSIQAQLNNDALSMLPLVSEALKNAGNFEYNQMYDSALRQICNATPCLADMTEKQIAVFDTQLIEGFKHKGWIKDDN